MIILDTKTKQPKVIDLVTVPKDISDSKVIISNDEKGNVQYISSNLAEIKERNTHFTKIIETIQKQQPHLANLQIKTVQDNYQRAPAKDATFIWKNFPAAAEVTSSTDGNLNSGTIIFTRPSGGLVQISYDTGLTSKDGDLTNLKITNLQEKLIENELPAIHKIEFMETKLLSLIHI